MIATDIMKNFPGKEVAIVQVDKNVDYHGERAVKVLAILSDGRTVEGSFTDHRAVGFGGVEFAKQKDVVGLMTAKIKSVLEGTAE